MKRLFYDGSLRFPLSLRMVDELLAARGIIVSHETVCQWALKFGQAFANQVRRRLPAAGDKWYLDEVVLTIAGVKHWLWRAIDQNGMVLDILVQSRRDTRPTSPTGSGRLTKLYSNGSPLSCRAAFRIPYLRISAPLRDQRFRWGFRPLRRTGHATRDGQRQPWHGHGR